MAKATPTKPAGAEAFVPEVRSIPKLAEAVKKCEGCDLCCLGGTQAVFGEGPATAKAIFVGEQPGDMEDRAGRPFVGPAGQLMDELLLEAGVDRSLIYITNTVKHFNYVQKGRVRLHKKPAARHVNACRPWFEAEVETIHPRIIVALGSTASQAIMGRDFRVTKQRGEIMNCPYAPKFMATIHPSALLRIPDDQARAEAKGTFIQDMRKVARQMKVA